MEVVVCPNCGEENPARFRLCGFCGTPLAAVLPPQEVRKPATFIFVDLKGSTALTERIDQEAMSEIKKRYFTVMAAQIERHGGTVEKYIGDAVMALFGAPVAHEDDPERAVRERP
jgi:class 3 adenylate cyclase